MSQLKIKNGSSWESIPAGGVGVPSGGSSGQVLQKSSSSDYATEWADVKKIAPAYASYTDLIGNPLPQWPSTTSASTKFTAPSDGLFTIFADRQNQGYTLFVHINGLDVISAPAHFGGIAFSVSLPLNAGDELALSCDGNSTWVVRVAKFIPWTS